ncbi:diphthamide synthesis protein [Candidatus Woesearchaeota archaeon]|nr:diphthamide synthesis protein [Candidatus Woesearchaeota archaeon]
MESFVDYDLELEKAVSEIKKSGAKTVCLQLPEGLRPKGGEIADRIHKDSGAVVFLWLGSCYGACDIPFDVERLGVDMLIQWGHSVWAY